MKKVLLAVFITLSLTRPDHLLASEIGIKALEENNVELAKQEFLKSIESDPQDAESYSYLSLIAVQEEETDDAEEFIEKALSIEPSNAELQYDAGGIYANIAMQASIFSATGYAEKSLNAYKKAVELAPKNIRYRSALMGFYLQAPGFAGGDDELAYKEFEAINALDKVEGKIALARFYRSTDQDVKLEKLYANLEQDDLKNAKLVFSRGMYFQNQEAYTKALQDLNRSSLLPPSDEEDMTPFSALYQVGRTSVLSQLEIDNGIKAMTKYIEIAPNDDRLPSKAWAKYRLGILYSLNGDKAKAKSMYAEVKSETSDKELLKQLKKSLKKLKRA